ncbi:MAG: shikimate kinase [Planctomycetota bacterium]
MNSPGDQPHLFLSGYRATGKTTIAGMLAGKLGLQTVDLDARIVAEAGRPIAEIFAAEGEAAFRTLETAMLGRVVAEENALVISLGGGTPVAAANRKIIRQSGRTVWLTASAETIHRRMLDDAVSKTQRPGLTDKSPEAEIVELLERRRTFYEEIADVEISTETSTPEAIVEQILRWWAK